MNQASLFLRQDRVVVAVAFDCVEKTVYWSDITAPAISRAGLAGGHVSAVVTEGPAEPRLHTEDTRCQSPDPDSVFLSLLRPGEP